MGDGSHHVLCRLRLRPTADVDSGKAKGLVVDVQDSRSVFEQELFLKRGR